MIQNVDRDGQPDIVVANLTPDGCELNFHRQIANGSERSFSLQSTVAIPHGGSPATARAQRVSLVGSGNQLEVRCTSGSWVDSVASRVVQITIGSGPEYTIRSDVIYSLNNSTYSVFPHVRSVFDADLNGDGRRDIGVANAADKSISLLLGQPDGDFARLDSVSFATPTASFAADSTGDGKADLLLLIGTTQLGLLPGQGDGTFGALRTFEAGLQWKPDGLTQIWWLH